MSQPQIIDIRNDVLSVPVTEQGGDVFEKAVAREAPARSQRPLLIVPAMLTPNGLMHVGHAAGPFVHADVLKRVAQSTGSDAFVLQGTHGH